MWSKSVTVILENNRDSFKTMLICVTILINNTDMCDNNNTDNHKITVKSVK